MEDFNVKQEQLQLGFSSKTQSNPIDSNPSETSDSRLQNLPILTFFLQYFC